ncbi:hypothetical protein NDU88_006594 [Pleurodeles waltl]|uniref:Pr1-like protein n=1 Tax=Pleurodeles waltl TaxID=8319 RepID=A0AAV7MZP7_PLEWA|nr:hypothetical protein NDU88_006594 [Pleurodeles waltl]
MRGLGGGAAGDAAAGKEAIWNGEEEGGGGRGRRGAEAGKEAIWNGEEEGGGGKGRRGRSSGEKEEKIRSGGGADGGAGSDLPAEAGSKVTPCY